jgi:hypothetical protein
MNERPFGRTGCTVSALGFGCMRLPMKDDTTVDRDRAIPLLLAARERGVTYFDTGKWYCGQDSERTLGEALKHMDRSSILLSTKYAMEHPTAADLREKLETSLRLLDQEYVDFYHFWGISWEQYETKLSIPGGPLGEFLKLKQEGLVRHLSFSFHSKPEDIPRIVDTGHFETMLCQYNLLDRANEEGIAYAASKGLGVVIMGPVGGGRLGAPSEVIGKMLDGKTPVSTPELALRFVLSNPNVSVALSGMSEMLHVEENCEIASRRGWLTQDEKARIVQSAQENRKFMDLYCTGCKYCMPCPHEVNISRVFEAMNHLKVWGLQETARSMYQGIGKNQWVKGKQADACEECGECEPKCPQKIPIIAQLKESHAALRA